MQIRLAPGGAYISDITQLCRDIRANGTRVNAANLVVSHPDHPASTVTLIVNLAYQPNNNLGVSTGSLYTLGFSNPQGVSRFTLNPMIVAGAPGDHMVARDGSYGSLGYPGPALPALDRANLANSVVLLSAYTHAGFGAAEATALTRLIIAVSEAARSTEVLNGVNGAVANVPYTAPWNVLHNWGGRTLAA